MSNKMTPKEKRAFNTVNKWFGKSFSPAQIKSIMSSAYELCGVCPGELFLIRNKETYAQEKVTKTQLISMIQ